MTVMRDVRDKGSGKTSEGLWSASCSRWFEGNSRIFVVGAIVKFQDFMDEPTLFSYFLPAEAEILSPTALTLTAPGTVSCQPSSTVLRASSATTLRPCTLCSLTNRLISAVAPRGIRCIKTSTTFPSGESTRPEQVKRFSQQR
jgi:hypothetical protein